MMSNGYLAFYNALSGIGLSSPNVPSKWTYTYLQRIRERTEKILTVNEDRIGAIVQARVMPDIADITIGSGKFFPSLAILFLDICGFSNWPNWEQKEQAMVLRVMNIFMASMLGIIRDFNGTCEKNTGDGLMAYFSEGNEEEQAKTAVEAATVMRYVNEHILQPKLLNSGLWPVDFRVGIDTGPATISRVGIHSAANQFVAIGTTANIACKLMRLVSDGGICIGEKTYSKLATSWQRTCDPVGNTTFVYVATRNPYPAWKIDHSLSEPNFPVVPIGGLR